MIRSILYNPSTDEISIGGNELLENWKEVSQYRISFTYKHFDSAGMIMSNQYAKYHRNG